MGKFTWRHLLGTCVAAAIIVLIAQVLNHFFGWTIAAFVIGAVVGLEVGFFVVNAKCTLAVHKALLDEFTGKSCDENEQSLGWVFSVALLIIGVFVASLLLFVQFHNAIGYIENTGYFPHWGYGVVGFVASIITMVFFVDYILKGSESFKVVKMMMVTAFVTVMWPFIAVLIVAALVLYYLSMAISFIMLCISGCFILAGDSEMLSVTIGSLTGAVVGLMLGWGLEMQTLTSSMLVAGVVGMAVGFVASKVGSMKFVKSAHDASDHYLTSNS